MIPANGMAGCITILSYLLSFVALFLDFLSPQGFTEWVFYMIPLLCISYTNNVRHLFRVSVLNTILLLIGYFFSEKITDKIVLFHRMLGIVMIWSVSLNIYRRTTAQNQLKILNENLENSVMDRTRQVRDLSKALTLAEQRERKRFSYILHENLQQQLLGAGLLLRQHLSEHKKLGISEVYDDVSDGLRLINNALMTTKTLSIELNPPILSSEGLDQALEWLIIHMNENYSLQVDFQKKGEIDQVRNETQLMLTQMVRELLYNVVAHSGVHRAHLEAICKKKQLLIIVSDKGKGFNPEEIMKKNPNKTMLGLFSIRERLRLFGGDLIIKSEVDKGSQLTILLPADVCKDE